MSGLEQPALLKLKEGLVSTQLKLSMLLGQMSERHPQVMAAREEEREIAKRLNEEVAVAIGGVEADVRVATERTTWLEGQRRELIGRLEKLAGKLKEFYSIRINDQWRIVFKWKTGSASEVEITDYH